MRMRITGPAGTARVASATLVLLALAVPAAHAKAQRATPSDNSQCSGQREASRLTPIAGKAFHTCFLGRQVDIPPHNRRSRTAWTAGADVTPRVDHRRVTPLAAIYIWRHPDANTLLRATLSGVYNHVFAADAPKDGGPWEGVFSFDEFALPFDRSEYVDGKRIRNRQLTRGHVRLGIGFGWHKQVAPGHEDNILAVSLRAEPGYYFFNRGDHDADAFLTPSSTYSTRVHLRLRWDALTRNLMALAHQGFALGADAVYGHRNQWDDWGMYGRQSGSGHRNFEFVQAYIRTASGIPGLNSRSRFLTSIHAGVGHNLDRFSAPRVGGGPISDEYGAIHRPVIPGTIVKAFYPNHYVIATAEYRYQVTFFTYVGLRGSVAYLDRRRRRGDDRVSRSNDAMESVGVNLTTGFLFHTRLALEYDYNTRVVRNGDYGGQAVLLQLSGSF